jgi:hypothetical protein
MCVFALTVRMSARMQCYAYMYVHMCMYIRICVCECAWVLVSVRFQERMLSFIP